MTEQNQVQRESKDDRGLKPYIIREIKMIAISLAVGVLTALPFAAGAYSDKVSGDLAENFIRFHVLANSDSETDQALKLKVRDGVLEMLKPELAACKDIDETRETLKTSFEEIRKEAERIITAEGFDYKVRVGLEEVLFPTRQYGDVTLVAGEYEALRIEIGRADGQNWWCVVYPPLCYVDVTHGEVAPEYKERMKEDLTTEQYQLVVENHMPEVQFKFKLVEIWQESKIAREKKEKEVVFVGE